jgi:hypothetical protein
MLVSMGIRLSSSQRLALVAWLEEHPPEDMRRWGRLLAAILPGLYAEAPFEAVPATTYTRAQRVKLLEIRQRLNVGLWCPGGDTIILSEPWKNRRRRGTRA